MSFIQTIYSKRKGGWSSLSGMVQRKTLGIIIRTARLWSESIYCILIPKTLPFCMGCLNKHGHIFLIREQRVLTDNNERIIITWEWRTALQKATSDHTKKKWKTRDRRSLCENPFFFFFSLNTFYFYYKYSSVVTKQSICHEGTVKHKECSAHKTGFVHNMWSGMLIIAGSEKERAHVRPPPLISHLYTPGKQR